MSIIVREQILGMIPHSGNMCLLDEILSWDAASVHALSRRYQDANNPLRRANGTLGAACGIEIAAQAMAVHGRLTAPKDGKPIPGYLVSLRDVRLNAPLLDDAQGPLLIEAKLLVGDGSGATYEFTVASEETLWLSGRATVLFGISQ